MSNAGWPSRRQVVAGAGAIAAGVMTTAHAASPLPMAHGYVFHDHRNTKRWKQGDRGIANVLVSNGVEVVRTDADGRWQLPAPPGSEVFDIKPPGWSLPRGPLGLTSFSQCVTAAIGNSAEIAEANSSSSIDFALQAADEKGAFVVALVADTQPQSDLELDFLRDSTLAAIAQSGATFAINHGDIVFDDARLYPRYLQLTAATGMPWHHCPGNHDMNPISDRVSDCFETWRTVFGPNPSITSASRLRPTRTAARRAFTC